jgi:hypothetical protein
MSKTTDQKYLVGDQYRDASKLDAEIARSGAFRIAKLSGLFVARPPSVARTNSAG